MPYEQPHPLYKGDRAICNRLLLVEWDPSNADITDAARLLNRYDGFPGCRDIRADLITAAKKWGFSSRDELNARSRAIWASGYRPGLDASEVGSGADVGPVESEDIPVACTQA